MEYVSTVCCQYAESGKRLCDQLQELGEVQSAMLLLRFCHVPRLNHLARSTFPEWLQPAAEIHDKITRDTFSTLMGYSNLPDRSWRQATLPVKFGGFGMTSCCCISRHAFVASWVYTLKELAIRYPDLQPALDLLVSSNNHRGSISMSFHQACGDEKDLTDLLQVLTKLQCKLTQEDTGAEISSMIETASCMRDEARLRSIQGKGAGAWLNAIPSSNKLAPVSRDFRLAAYLRLDLAMPFNGCNPQCDCGSYLDGSGYHLMSCKWGGGPVWTHDCISNVWSDCLRSLQMHHRREPRHRYIASDNCPDITVSDFGSGSNTDLDVSFAHPLSSDVIFSSASTEGAAALRREQTKAEKYSIERLPGEEAVRLVPLVLEHWTLGTTGRKILASAVSQVY